MSRTYLDSAKRIEATLSANGELLVIRKHDQHGDEVGIVGLSHSQWRRLRAFLPDVEGVTSDA